jgi:DNA ligase 1
MLFSKFSFYCNQISSNGSRTCKRNILLHCFLNSEIDEIQKIIYILQGRIGSVFDNINVNVSSGLLVKWIKSFLYLKDNSFNDLLKKHGDIGTVFQNQYNKMDSSLLLIDVYRYLEEIAFIKGDGSVSAKEKLFFDVLSNLDSASGCYLIRAIEGNLRIGLSEMTIIESLSMLSIALEKKAKDNLFQYDNFINLISSEFKREYLTYKDKILEKYGIFPDLGEIAKKIFAGGIIGIDRIGINIGVPIIPQAANRVKSPNEIQKVKSFPLFAQTKYDGLRIQIHYEKSHSSNVFMYSRNLLPMHDMFPEIKRNISTIFDDSNIESMIYEGEVVSYNSKLSMHGTFQDTSSRRRKYNIDEFEKSNPAIFVVFDLLYINGKSMLSETCEARFNKIKAVFKGYPGNNIFIVDNFIVNNLLEIKNVYSHSTKGGHEGIIIKDPYSNYRPGKRSCDWIKLKSLSTGGRIDTIDAVVIGYCYGKGRMARRRVGALLVGVYSVEDETYYPIAKVGTGLSEDLWKSLEIQLNNISTNKAPKNVYDKIIPNVWCEPKIIVSVDFDLITQSKNYPCGYSLRFPSLKKIVKDKSLEHVTSKREIEGML